ncbi:hypothetical protein ACFIQG_20655 [Comamonas odontotermitis]|uniref:hypothetical protein n=1 Tax=Comamonas odontotermitis TaxID=379895 RepID=UPI00366EDC04
MLEIKRIMNELMQLNGAVYVSLVDYYEGKIFAQSGDIFYQNTGVQNSSIVREKIQMIEGLGIKESVVDIQINLSNHYHLIHISQRISGLYIYLVLEKIRANIQIARWKLDAMEKGLSTAKIDI